MTPRNTPPKPISEADAAVLEQLWNAHSRSVYSAALAFTRNEADAADVLALTFQRIATRLVAATSADNPRAFLITAARNVAVDLARQGLSREKREEIIAGVDGPEAQSPSILSDQDLRAAIMQALASLPGEQRRAVEGRLIRGLTLEAIARNEKVSLQTIASRFRYGIDKVREQLRPYYDCITNQSMKSITHQSNTPETARIIHTLEPKRVPSVAPGLEGFAAFAPDDANFEEAPEVEEIPADELPAEDLGDFAEIEDIENPADIITDVFEPETGGELPVAFDDLFVIHTFEGQEAEVGEDIEDVTDEEVEVGEDIEDVTDEEVIDAGTEGDKGDPIDPQILYMTGGPVTEGLPEGYDPSWVIRGGIPAETSPDGAAVTAGALASTGITEVASAEILVMESSDSDFPEVVLIPDDAIQSEASDYSHDLAQDLMAITGPEIEMSGLSDSFSMDLPVNEVVATVGADEVSDITAETSVVDTFVPRLNVAEQTVPSESSVTEPAASPAPEETATVLAAIQAPSTQTALAAALVTGTVLQTHPARKQSKV